MVPAVAVTFKTTAPASAGTPPRPATSSLSVEPAATGPAPSDLASTVVSPGRVSSRRAGVNEWYPDAAGKYPPTSATTLTAAAPTKRHTVPAADSPVMTWLVIGALAVKFKLEAVGLAASHANAVM